MLVDPDDSYEQWCPTGLQTPPVVPATAEGTVPSDEVFHGMAAHSQRKSYGRKSYGGSQPTTDRARVGRVGSCGTFGAGEDRGRTKTSGGSGPSLGGTGMGVLLQDSVTDTAASTRPPQGQQNTEGNAEEFDVTEDDLAELGSQPTEPIFIWHLLAGRSVSDSCVRLTANMSTRGSTMHG